MYYHHNDVMMHTTGDLPQHHASSLASDNLFGSLLVRR